MEGAEVQDHGDLIVYRASSLGACTKRLVAARLGYEPLPVPKDMMARFQEGHLHEPAVLEHMVGEGWRIYDQQAEVKVKVSGRLSVVGHIDAKGYKMDKGFLVEVKSQSDEAFKEFDKNGWESGLFPKYRWQVSVYMLATGFTCCMVRKNRNTGQIKVSYVDEPFYSLAEIRSRVLEIESWARRGELPDTCSSNDWPCPVGYLHVREDREQLDDEAIDVLAHQYSNLSLAGKVLEGKKKETSRAIKDALGDKEKIETKSGVKVTVFDVKRRSLSEKLLKDAGIDVDQYKVESFSSQMRVTMPKDDKDDDGSE